MGHGLLPGQAPHLLLAHTCRAWASRSQGGQGAGGAWLGAGTLPPPWIWASAAVSETVKALSFSVLDLAPRLGRRAALPPGLGLEPRALSQMCLAPAQALAGKEGRAPGEQGGGSHPPLLSWDLAGWRGHVQSVSQLFLHELLQGL